MPTAVLECPGAAYSLQVPCADCALWPANALDTLLVLLLTHQSALAAVLDLHVIAQSATAAPL